MFHCYILVVFIQLSSLELSIHNIYLISYSINNLNLEDIIINCIIDCILGHTSHLKFCKNQDNYKANINCIIKKCIYLFFTKGHNNPCFIGRHMSLLSLHMQHNSDFLKEYMFMFQSEPLDNHFYLNPYIYKDYWCIISICQSIHIINFLLLQTSINLYHLNCIDLACNIIVHSSSNQFYWNKEFLEVNHILKLSIYHL